MEMDVGGRGRHAAPCDPRAARLTSSSTSDNPLEARAATGAEEKEGVACTLVDGCMSSGMGIE